MKKIIITFLSLVLSLVPLCQAQQAVNHQAMLQQLSPQDLKDFSEQLQDDQKEALEQILESKDVASFLFNPRFLVPLGSIAFTGVLFMISCYLERQDPDLESRDPEAFRKMAEKLTEELAFL